MPNTSSTNVGKWSQLPGLLRVLPKGADGSAYLTLALIQDGHSHAPGTRDTGLAVWLRRWESLSAALAPREPSYLLPLTPKAMLATKDHTYTLATVLHRVKKEFYT